MISLHQEYLASFYQKFYLGRYNQLPSQYQAELFHQGKSPSITDLQSCFDALSQSHHGIVQYSSKSDVSTLFTS